MTPRMLACEANANVIALTVAHHHMNDDFASEFIAGMTETERTLALISAVSMLTDRYQVDAHEMGLTFDDYIQPLAAAIARKGTA